MRSKWTKLISVVCLVAMLVGMLPVVASAALAEGDASKGIYVWDIQKESAAVPTAGATAGTSGYFTLYPGEVKTGKRIYGSEGDADYLAGTMRFTYGGKTDNSHFTAGKTPTARTIGFKVTNKNTTLKIWWYNSGDTRYLNICDGNIRSRGISTPTGRTPRSWSGRTPTTRWWASSPG